MVAFSTHANAEVIETPSIYIHNSVYAGNVHLGSLDYYPGDGTQTTTTFSPDWPPGGSNTLKSVYFVQPTDDFSLITAGKFVSILFENLFFEFILTNLSTHAKTTINTVSECYAEVKYTDDTVVYIPCSFDNRGGGLVNVTVEFTPEKDVVYVAPVLEAIFERSSGIVYRCTAWVGEWGKNHSGSGDTLQRVIIDQQSEEASLLGGIWDSLSEGFNNMVQSITELPQNIWSLIENGLKALFVPDEQYMVVYKDKWEISLSHKLGAVYQVVDVTLESWDRISVSDEANIVKMPEVSIPLPEGNSFSFGGYDVLIVPTGFEGLASTCKMIAGIVCTILFVNGLRKRYDEVMGVEQ